ncbi:MAG: methyltransferase domain-containing protein [Anaerolineales bacterium]|nr:methyltransferase domain-containing protein [Chloroflexota bacterium]MBL6979800.1 methyltransferase domain-containing protein [Anaerolineales bacterium]
MTLSTLDWHKRFEQQARWTQDLRRYLYPRVGLSEAEQILDVGCGTGALLGELNSLSDVQIFGVDIQHERLELAQTKDGVLLSQGDAHQLPFPKDRFDITQCHFTLMWVADPQKVLAEMVRVTNPGGTVVALAEPDYGGRIDYPQKLEQIGQWQIESLRSQGADPFMGRKLSALFNEAGLINIESGVLGAQWMGALSKDEVNLEWAVLESDLEKTFRDSESLNVFKEIDKTSRENGERVLYVPTFYAVGWK